MEARFTPPQDLSPYQAYIFDCDGTLADSMGAHFVAWQSALKSGGANFDFTWDLFLSRAGMSMKNTVLELSQQFGVSLDVERILREQRALFLSSEKNIGPVGAVVDFARLVARDFPVAVASGSPRVSVDRSLEGIGVLDLFPLIITPEDVSHGKPNPDMFLLAAERMGIAPRACLVIEDGELGIEAARRAHMDCAIVKNVAPDG